MPKNNNHHLPLICDITELKQSVAIHEQFHAFKFISKVKDKKYSSMRCGYKN